MGYERVKNLEKMFKSLDRKGAKEVDMLMTKIRKVSNREKEVIMAKINKLIGGYGVEVIRGSSWWSRYYGDIIASYINKGDTYDPTILINHKTNMPMITTMGDFVERNTRRYGIQ